MATGYVVSVSAIQQVGSYFIEQYYQILLQQPNFVHQFYTDSSTVVRIDGSMANTASGMLQIHNLIMSLSLGGIEIKTARSLESWGGGILVTVSGSVHAGELGGWRNFVQTFFLAPQEKGYFVLNDIFHLQDEEQQLPRVATMSGYNDFDSMYKSSFPNQETAFKRIIVGEVPRNGILVPANAEESKADEHITPAFQGGRENVCKADDRAEGAATEQPASSFPSSSNFQCQHSSPVDEPIEELRHTYASVLQVPKGRTGHAQSPETAGAKQASPASERHHIPQITHQQSNPAFEVEDATAADEGGATSVYVRNLPSSASASELEQEFLSFGRVKPGGVLIKNRKEAGVCYAFVEFEDTRGVENALRASPIQFCGYPIHVEERRPRSQVAPGGRSRPRGGRLAEKAPRGAGPGAARRSGRGSRQENGGRARANGSRRRHEQPAAIEISSS
ncbi:unnamed protein product [Spirodela intermedia]|uniref:Uncharacterized protein n=1 Tax=Spirodela intermedia TaxID=51605 RepID=A0A7I8LL69_SPIIN|nr:unnamed protein product [Spirodela intermedia]